MNNSGVILKQGKEKPLLQRHCWIFSGAVHNYPTFNEGDLLPVYSFKHELLGHAYFNRVGSIVGRVIAFGKENPFDAIKRHIQNAIQLRKALFASKATTGFRLINGEGDFLPGLVADLYNQVLVIQISTKGMSLLKPFVLECLIELLKPEAIYEKSLLPSLKNEGLKEEQTLLYGSLPPLLSFKEHGLTFYVSVEEGQKTGFFLDHREMRQLVKTMSEKKRVLNCFSYTGGFSVYAGAGGAAQVTSVDISHKAIEMAKRNVSANFSDLSPFTFQVADVFEYLRHEPLNFDLVILDPPAFAKKQKDVVTACRGYKDINRLAMQKMPSRSLLLTCSCSHYVDETLFAQVVFQAALEAKREVQILHKHTLAADHPINIYHPESAYLKSLLLYLP